MAHDQSLFICCEDGSKKQYFELKKEQTTISECLLPHNIEEDICGLQLKTVNNLIALLLRD